LIYLFLIAIFAWVIYVFFKNESTDEVATQKKKEPTLNNSPQVVHTPSSLSELLVRLRDQESNKLTYPFSAAPE
jgi:uncharacterized protein YpmS